MQGLKNIALRPGASNPTVFFCRDTENFFGEEELDPYCKFCFAKKFKVSAMNIADIVNLDATGPSPKSL